MIDQADLEQHYPAATVADMAGGGDFEPNLQAGIAASVAEAKRHLLSKYAWPNEAPKSLKILLLKAWRYHIATVTDPTEEHTELWRVHDKEVIAGYQGALEGMVPLASSAASTGSGLTRAGGRVRSGQFEALRHRVER